MVAPLPSGVLGQHPFRKLDFGQGDGEETSGFGTECDALLARHPAVVDLDVGLVLGDETLVMPAQQVVIAFPLEGKLEASLLLDVVEGGGFGGEVDT